MSVHAPHIRSAIAWLRSCGATDVRTEPGGKHPKLVFTWAGKECRYTISGTPRNQDDAASAARQDIARMFGVRGPERLVSPKPSRYRRTIAKPIARPSAFTALADGLSALNRHPQAAVIRAQRLDQAWLALWRDAMAAAGGRSLL